MSDSLFRHRPLSELGFLPSSYRILEEAGQRRARAARKILYHVPYLDDLLLGIFPNDLILLGAWTGVGKTAAASMIAQSNARDGKRVSYFALEAEDLEIERRIKFRIVCDLLWTHRPATARKLSMRYADWYAGKYADEIKGEEKFADDEIDRCYREQLTFYRGTTFGSPDLVVRFLSLEGKTDLIVLDHLHYVDADGDNENRAYKETVKLIRDMSLRIGIPVLCVVHLRKRDQKASPLVPTLDDVMGTSDIAKIATHAIMLAPMDADAWEAHWHRPPPRHLSPTYMHVAKDRRGGLTPYCAVACFDLRTSAYEPGYRLGKLNHRGDTFKPVLAADLPDWAARAEGRGEAWEP